MLNIANHNKSITAYYWLIHESYTILGRQCAVRTHRLDQGSAVVGQSVRWSDGDGSRLQWGWQHWETGQWTAQGKGHTSAAAGTGSSVVSKERTGASRAPGIDAGHNKGAQCRGLGLGLLVAHDKGGSRWGGGGGGFNGMKMNGSPPSPFL